MRSCRLTGRSKITVLSICNGTYEQKKEKDRQRMAIKYKAKDDAKNDKALQMLDAVIAKKEAEKEEDEHH